MKGTLKGKHREESPSLFDRAAKKLPIGGGKGKGRTAVTSVVAIVAVALVLVFTLVSYAQLVMVNDQVVNLRKQLSDLKTEETKLTAQYELAYDLQAIESQMISSGQMSKVKDWQSYILELSEPDSVEYYQGSHIKERVIAFAKEFVVAVKEYF